MMRASNKSIKFSAEVLAVVNIKENMKKLIAAVLLSSAVFTMPAFASGPFYAGLQVGSGFSVLGGYMLDKTIAVEVDYTNYGGNGDHRNCGRNNCNNFNYYNYSSLGAFLVGSLPLEQALSLFGKVGLVSTTVSYRDAGFSYSSSDLGLGLGLGAQYDFTKKISGRIGVSFNTYYTSDLYIGAYYKF